MSTVVAVRKGSNASIAADTLTTFGDIRLASHYEMAHDKIHRFGDSYMGMVGSAAHHIVLEDIMGGDTPPRFGSRLEIFETVLALHPTLKEKYFLNPKDEDDDPYESSRMDALIVNRRGVFAVYSMREVFEYSRFWAIGSGAEFALGAMHALYDRLDEADTIARAGVEAGAEFNNATSLPMTRYTVRLD